MDDATTEGLLIEQSLTVRPGPDHTGLNALAEAPVQVSYSSGGDQFVVTVPPDEIRERLGAFDGRRRTILVALLNGLSRQAACARAGITTQSLRNWTKANPEFADAVSWAMDVGFAAGPEAELYRRALAGPTDPGSMRALELVLKSRSPVYQERGQASLAAEAARESVQRLAAGWEGG